jgi:glycosyltransferase involved in cell wall biosynthesis
MAIRKINLQCADAEIYPTHVRAVAGDFHPVGVRSMDAFYYPSKIAQLEELSPSNPPIGVVGTSNLFSDIVLPSSAESGEISPEKPVLPKGLFSQSPEAGALILQRYLDALPADERYDAFAPLVRAHWKWMCKAAPYLKFPEPQPILEGQRVNIGIRIWRMTSGGIERVIQLLANHFEENPKYHVTIFIDSGQTESIDFPLHENITIVGVPRCGRGCNINWKKIIEEYPQDLVICPEHCEIRNIQNILLLKFLGVRIFAQEHNFILWPRPFNSSDEKIEYLSGLYSRCDAVSCLSQVDLDAWQCGGLSNSIYLPNPPTFDPANVTPSEHKTKNIIWVGQWWLRWKRPEMAVEAFAKVLEKVPDARLIMLGKWGNFHSCKRCKQRIRELGIGHAVDIVGFQKDMIPYYSNGVILLSTSRFEGFPMVMNEAKTFGLPVVSTEMPYLETLKKGCVQVPRNDVDALADAVTDLLQNPEKRRQLGAEGRRDMLENFSKEVTFAKYDALMEAILAGPDAVAKLCAAEPAMDAEMAARILAEEAKIWK